MDAISIRAWAIGLVLLFSVTSMVRWGTQPAPPAVPQAHVRQSSRAGSSPPTSDPAHDKPTKTIAVRTSEPRASGRAPYASDVAVPSKSRKPVTAEAPVDSSLARACDSSGMCSLGVSEFYSGDIATASGLKGMIQAVSYNNEIIVTCIGGAELAADQILQLYDELVWMGFGHFVALARTRDSCDMVWKWRPGMSCVWDSSPILESALDGVTLLWHLRWRLLARLARLGVNAMSVDMDTIFWQDPYPYLAAQPFARAKLLCMAEGGFGNCNGGFVRVQNTLPDSPTAWVMMHTAEVVLRWMDDDLEFTTAMNTTSMGGPMCLSFDQSHLQDAIHAAMFGRPSYACALLACKSEHWTPAMDEAYMAAVLQRVADGKAQLADDALSVAMREADGDSQARTRASFAPMPKNREEALANLDHLGPARGQHLVTHYTWDEPPKGIAGVKPTDRDILRTDWFNLSLPNLRYGTPAVLGGRIFPAVKGPYSQALYDQLRDDCPDCPSWNLNRPLPPDVAQKEKACADGAGTCSGGSSFVDTSYPIDSAAHLPGWLVGGMNSQRLGTWLGPSLQGMGNSVPQVVGHIHVWDGTSGHHNKMALRKVVGRYNYTLSAELLNATRSGPYQCACSVQKTLAFSPALVQQMVRTRDVHEFNKLVTGLIQVALLTGRTPVLPDVPCATPWLHDPQYVKQGLPVCVPGNMFNHRRYNQPLASVYPVDKANKTLLGGWLSIFHRVARKLASSWQRWLGATAVSAAGSDGLEQGGVHVDRQLQESEPLTHWHAVSHHKVLGHQQPRQMQASTPDGSDNSNGYYKQELSTNETSAWWAAQEYMAALPFLWDEACTQGVGSLMVSEFWHWLNSPAAKGVTAEATSDNTVLQPGAQQKKLQLTRADAPAKGRAWVPQDRARWSLADIQVLLPPKQVAAELAKHANEPLLYLGHPVAVGFKDSTEEEASSVYSAQDLVQALKLKKYDAVASFLGHRQCKAFFELDLHDIHSTATRLDLSGVQPGKVGKDGQLTAAA